MYSQTTLRFIYKKLIAFYPQAFREELGESMEQTFNDLYRERQQEHRLFSFVFWTFAETGVGILQEHILVIRQGAGMKNMISNPTSAAITSFILSLPLGLTFIAFMFEIEQLAKPITAIFTSNGYDLTMPGRIFMISGLILLPVAFVLNLLPMLKRAGPERRRRLFAINFIVGLIILLLIAFTWGGLILEEIYCLQGIRCD